MERFRSQTVERDIKQVKYILYVIVYYILYKLKYFCATSVRYYLHSRMPVLINYNIATKKFSQIREKFL